MSQRGLILSRNLGHRSSPPADKLLASWSWPGLPNHAKSCYCQMSNETSRWTPRALHIQTHKSLQWVSPSFNCYPWGAMSCVRSWLIFIFPLPNLSISRWWHRWYKATYLIPLTWPFENQVKNCWRQITNGTNHSTPCASVEEKPGVLNHFAIHVTGNQFS